MLEQAYAWVCNQRLDRSHNNSILDLRYNWSTIKPRLQQQLRTEQYFLSPLQSYFINGEWISSWTATDALVLKALTCTLQLLFSTDNYPHCTHLKHAGGIHEAIRQVSQHQNNYQHILKSDAYHFLGCIKKGFDFLGVHFDALPTIAKVSLEKHRIRLAQRYAQGVSSACIGDYVVRWTSWCKRGVC